ncbi:hypothetical protein BAE30_00350 [Acidithiobacillus caldus]|uniref:Uncharacterized protein n=1 Tax=Acidithiobacillus caldus TaxID=33059 RepID=A0A1E7Z470_9PROT|nr:hypothetical protein BAE30_00350 [Acidithiobacillus caldus]
MLTLLMLLVILYFRIPLRPPAPATNRAWLADRCLLRKDSTGPANSFTDHIYGMIKAFPMGWWP